jgi:signal peptidase I
VNLESPGPNGGPSDAEPAPAIPLRGAALAQWLQRVVRALWLGVIPALLAALCLRFLVPAGGTGPADAVAWLGNRFAVPLGVALFFAWSAMARYWRFWLPGGRYASELPAHLVPGERDGLRLAEWATDFRLYELAASPAVQKRVQAGARFPVDAALEDLHRALEAGDGERARGAAAALRSHLGAALAAHRNRAIVTTLAGVAVAGACAFALRAWVAQPYRVVSSSMLPTFEPADLVLASKRGAGGAPRDRGRGDVIAFHSSAVALPVGLEAPEILVKRVIGLPGDVIGMKGGQPIINGWPVPFCDAGEYVYLQAEALGGPVHGRLRVEFLDDRTYLTVHSMGAGFASTYEVKDGEVFVLGDNRGNSADSRAWNGGHGGGVPLAAIEGRAEWFLLGSHRSGDVDFGRFGRPIDRLDRGVHLESVNAQKVDDGIARCLAQRPSDTTPPRRAGLTSAGVAAETLR